MGFEVLSRKPGQRRFEVGCLAILIGALFIAPLALYLRRNAIERQATAICEAIPIGSTFDTSEFSKNASASGFGSFVREGSPDSSAVAYKAVFAFLRYFCVVEYRDGVVTSTEVQQLD